MSKIYKKKELLETMSEVEELDELVDEKGGKIDGAEKIDQSDKMTTTKDTTDDHLRKSRQGMSRYMYRSFYGEEDESKEPESLEEMSEEKMTGVLEDIFTKKRFERDVLDKVRYADGIPEIDIIKEKHPVLVRKIAHIKSLIDKDEVSGEDKAIMLNSILSTNLVDIPAQYKKELSRKLGY
jgi:hypothetical protein